MEKQYNNVTLYINCDIMDIYMIIYKVSGCNMTILDYLRGKKLADQMLDSVLDIIKEEFGSVSNENYQLSLDSEANVVVRIPSLKKNDEYEFKALEDYEYQVVMCMNIDELYTEQYMEYITKKFLELYKEDLIKICHDVKIIDELKIKVKSLKKKIEYISYGSICGIILLSILLILKNNMGGMSKGIIGGSIVLLFTISIYEQCSKDKQVKSLIDGYISIIKTEWYNKIMRKQYLFLCNIMD